eukprot:SM000081S22649  [mRNA]  locus=s81:324085:324889:+ [translate_table: standard]
MGGLCRKRKRLQGRIEGSIDKLRKQWERETRANEAMSLHQAATAQRRGSAANGDEDAETSNEELTPPSRKRAGRTKKAQPLQTRAAGAAQGAAAASSRPAKRAVKELEFHSDDDMDNYLSPTPPLPVRQPRGAQAKKRPRLAAAAKAEALDSL